MQVGTTKDQGLYNKLSAAVHPGGISRQDLTGVQYNTYCFIGLSYIMFCVCEGRADGYKLWKEVVVVNLRYCLDIKFYLGEFRGRC